MTLLRLLAAAAVLALFGGGAPAAAAPRSDAPADPGITVRAPNGLPVNKCVPEALRKNTISLRTSDGVRISGLALGSGKKGVVLEHEQGWFICSWLPFAQVLAARGYHVVLLEARGTGASADTSEADHYHLDRDFLAASQELTRRGATAIVAGGASLGGTAAATSAPRIPNLAGLVIFSSPRTYGSAARGMDAVAAVKTVTKPSFFAVSPGDMGDGFLVEVKGLHAASGAAEKHFVTVGGGIHGVAMMDSEQGGAALKAKLLAFIDGAFPAEAPDPGPTPPAPARAQAPTRPWVTVALTAGAAAAIVLFGLLRLRRSRGGADTV